MSPCSVVTMQWASRRHGNSFQILSRRCGAGGEEIEAVWTKCGQDRLPASGKSTCARQLTDGRGTQLTVPLQIPIVDDEHENNLLNPYTYDQDRYCFYHIAYDNIMPTDIENKLLEPRKDFMVHICSIDEESSQWKLYRKEIVKCVAKHLLQHIPLGEYAESAEHLPKAEIWKVFLKCLEESYPENVRSNPVGVDTDIVYIIDDNMYYRSMRFEYYQLARKYNIGFAQVHFESTVELSQKRNNSRPLPVRPVVIEAMAKRLEAPGNTEPCDKHLLIVGADKDGGSYIRAVLRLLAETLEDPVPALEVRDEAALQEAREVCSTNLIHQSDKALRQLVTSTMAQAKADGLDKTALRELAVKMNGARQRLLEDMRQGHLLVESDLNEEIHGGNVGRANSSVSEFVKTLLDRELKWTQEES